MDLNLNEDLENSETVSFAPDFYSENESGEYDEEMRHEFTDTTGCSAFQLEPNCRKGILTRSARLYN